MCNRIASGLMCVTLLLVLPGCQQAESPQTVDADSRQAATPATVESVPMESSVSRSPEVVRATKITPPANGEPLVEPPQEVKPMTIGDPAPPLSIAEWVTGDAIDAFEDGQLYVVEFWATWCGPCLSSMPHLSELTTELEDEVKIIGVTREDVETVETFLAKEQSEGTTWREVITYRLAIDDDDATNAAYMKAAEQTGIPAAFIVGRDGIIEWIGHPAVIDEPLASLVEGTYDRSAAIIAFQDRQRQRRQSRELSQLMQSGGHDAALELIQDMEDESGAAPGFTMAKLSILKQAGRDDEAAAVQEQLIEDVWERPMMLNRMAWDIAIESDPRNLDLALRAATQAAELTKHENSAILDTLARVYYEQGNLEEAIEWQARAVEHGEGQPTYEETLNEYKAEVAENAAPDSEEAAPSAEGDEPEAATESPAEDE